ncbi:MULTISPECIES: MFS transporter [Burkholderia]|nr:MULTISPECIES: MFS transporter [Burkholderia]ATF90180.1 MFS transporter [Burkholderia gladioli pv. gladioli]MBJ9665758.1 MHS family MFS transporter [Burkholderia gladioli]MBJ9713358.1 MHS family MFS transporter [Burkholderia gladioli]MBU9168056.1 MHS family MFS transporter [Burkholderia gladioli]MBU9382507.1 MHS family MFS transporter [Burkholderia gladioli]
MNALASTSPTLEQPRAGRGRLATASMIGTSLEWYDFTVYNTLAALVFNHLFFPSVDPLAGTLLAFSTYAVGYVSRPLGGFVFGNLGDKLGRRAVLMLTLLLMGITTALMGVLPTYQSAGILSPILLVSLRFVQGIALGGEWAGAVLLSVEHGNQKKRGLNASWAQVGPSFGTLLGTGFIALITISVSSDAFLAWGWRVPFLASLLLVVFGLWVRRGVGETPAFEKLSESHNTAKVPVAEVFSQHWRRLLVAGGSRIGSDVLYALIVVFTLTYVTTVLNLSRSLALTAVLCGTACNALTVPLFGALSDRFGRRPVYLGGVLAAIVWAFAFFSLVNTSQPGLIVLAVVIGLVIHAVMYGPQAAFVTEQFPTRVRYAGSSLAYTLAGILGGGFAPLIIVALFRNWHTTIAVSLYVTGALIITAIALLAARETAHRALED